MSNTDAFGGLAFTIFCLAATTAILWEDLCELFLWVAW